ncbi:MAG TPA: SAM-dependent methyltransferase, partial [Lachnoclostridium phytofermentans]|nr:SAM-dependent methyltransferase [Lachnoclostridium phytofermentans]
MNIRLPEEFKKRMQEMLSEEYKAYEKCYEEKHRGGLRINTLKLNNEEFEKISPYDIKRVPFIPNGYYYQEKEQPARHPYYFGGLYYIQEPSAMTPASLLPVEPGDKVLDVCAAPGGKSTELAAKLQGEGVLVSNDISNSRAKALLKNIELFGVRNPVVVSEAPAKLVNRFTGDFD